MDRLTEHVFVCDECVYLQFMLSTFLLPSSPQKIFCSSSVVDGIVARQATLSEQLFDAAEEHALAVLLDAWTEASANDLSVFHKVSTILLAIHEGVVTVTCVAVSVLITVRLLDIL